jgi:hypothetical protein
MENIMDELEKVEKLRQRANVSYEEARDALNACGGDMLEAMVYLEKLGKVKGPEQSSYSTNYEEKNPYYSVQERVDANKDTGEGFFKKLKKLCKLLIKKSVDNYFCISRKGEMIFKVPVWVLVIALLCAWHVLVPVMVIALFFECRYSFCGKDNLDSANKCMDKAGKMADKVKDEFNKL